MHEGNGGYTAEQHFVSNMNMLAEGLINDRLQPLQQNRPYYVVGKGASDDLCECVRKANCFRSVSQRSLSTPWRFASIQSVGPPNIPATTGILFQLTQAAQGCLGTVLPVIFADANNNVDRARINNLVLVALRAQIDVALMDAEPVAVGAINVSTLQQRIEDFAYQYMQLKIFHLADRAEPWVDSTNLGYFMRPMGEYVPIPPIMWADRDPAMQLSMGVAEFGAGAGITPDLTSALRDLVGTMSVNIEGLWLPDPSVCPDAWPGELCPKNTIGMSPWYTGPIQTARKNAKRD